MTSSQQFGQSNSDTGSDKLSQKQGITWEDHITTMTEFEVPLSIDIYNIVNGDEGDETLELFRGMFALWYWPKDGEGSTWGRLRERKQFVVLFTGWKSQHALAQFENSGEYRKYWKAISKFSTPIAYILSSSGPSIGYSHVNLGIISVLRFLDIITVYFPSPVSSDVRRRIRDYKCSRISLMVGGKQNCEASKAGHWVLKKTIKRAGKEMDMMIVFRSWSDEEEKAKQSWAAADSVLKIEDEQGERTTEHVTLQDSLERQLNDIGAVEHETKSCYLISVPLLVRQGKIHIPENGLSKDDMRKINKIF